MRVGMPRALACGSASERLRASALALTLASALLDAAALRTKLECDAGWGTFGEEPLVRTANNVDLAPANSLHAFKMDVDIFKTFMHPESRFAFCPIEKNAHTVWNTILNRIFTGDPGAGLNHNVNVASWYRYKGEAYYSLFEDPQATRAVFVRDPLVRFVSAYLDKCVRKTCGYKPLLACCPMYKEGMTFRDAVEFAKIDPLADNHWKPQGEHCDLSRTIGRYTVIGLVTRETTSRDSSCLLRKANLSQWDIWGTEQDHDNANTFAPAANMSEEDVLKRFFTPAAARDLINRYRIDYDTFGFPAEPAWLKDAVGDWYDANPMRMASRHHAWENDADDDIAVLAWQAGYM